MRRRAEDAVIEYEYLTPGRESKQAEDVAFVRARSLMQGESCHISWGEMISFKPSDHSMIAREYGLELGDSSPTSRHEFRRTKNKICFGNFEAWLRVRRDRGGYI